MREQIARYIEQDVPYIDWSWYLWRAYKAMNEIEIYAEHSAWAACDDQRSSGRRSWPQLEWFVPSRHWFVQRHSDGSRTSNRIKTAPGGVIFNRLIRNF